MIRPADPSSSNSAGLGEDKSLARRRRLTWWSALATLLLLPLSSYVFLWMSGESSISTRSAFLFPLLIFHWQGLLTGFVVDMVLIACTFTPIWLLVQRILGRQYRSDSRLVVSRDANLCPGTSPNRPPWPVRLVALFDFVAGAILAISVIDYPAASVLVLLITWPVAFGLFTGKIWGWWPGMILHVLLMAAGLIAWGVFMFLAIQDFGRPRGHMELVTSEGAAAIMTILFVAFELIAVVPVLVLKVNRTRKSSEAS